MKSSASLEPFFCTKISARTFPDLESLEISVPSRSNTPVTGFAFPACPETPIGMATPPDLKKLSTSVSIAFDRDGNKIAAAPPPKMDPRAWRREGTGCFVESPSVIETCCKYRRVAAANVILFFILAILMYQLRDNVEISVRVFFSCKHH